MSETTSLLSYKLSYQKPDSQPDLASSSQGEEDLEKFTSACEFTSILMPPSLWYDYNTVLLVSTMSDHFIHMIILDFLNYFTKVL